MRQLPARQWPADANGTRLCSRARARRDWIFFAVQRERKMSSSHPSEEDSLHFVKSFESEIYETIEDLRRLNATRQIHLYVYTFFFSNRRAILVACIFLRARARASLLMRRPISTENRWQLPRREREREVPTKKSSSRVSRIYIYTCAARTPLAFKIKCSIIVQMKEKEI